jgi:protoheme ferro-lyase
LSIDTLERLPYYEYQLYIDMLNDKIEAENKKATQGDLVEAFSFHRPKI